MLEVGIAALQRVLAADGVVTEQRAIANSSLTTEPGPTTRNPTLPITDH